MIRRKITLASPTAAHSASCAASDFAEEFRRRLRTHRDRFALVSHSLANIGRYYRITVFAQQINLRLPLKSTAWLRSLPA
jgi:hypothetical protein